MAQLDTEPAYKEITITLAVKNPDGTIQPQCLCGARMMQKGMKLLCKNNTCPLEIDRASYDFFCLNDYIKWTTVDGVQKHIVSAPLCISCNGKGLALLSYISPKTEQYPAHKGIVWRCPCKTSYRAGYRRMFMDGWKKYGPVVDDELRGGAVFKAVDVSTSRPSFDFSNFLKK